MMNHHTVRTLHEHRNKTSIDISGLSITGYINYFGNLVVRTIQMF